jgi:two-component sensor histidine kinase
MPTCFGLLHESRSLALVEQLDGTIELDRSAGTAFTIVVKEKE